MKYITLFFIAGLFNFLLTACGNNATSKENTADEKVGNIDAGGSGSGLYYELSTSTHSERMSMGTLIKMFLSPDGNIRTEMTTSGIPGKRGVSPMILIGKSSNPTETTIIDDSAKTYTINHIDSNDLKTSDQIKSTAVKIGDEKIGDYNCVHAQVIAIRNMGPLGNLVDTLDIWKSNDVPILPAFKKWMVGFEKRTGNGIYSSATVAQLEQMGCTGFMVKLTMNSKSTAMVTQLTKVEHKDFTQGMFEIPAGYKEDKSGAF